MHWKIWWLSAMGVFLDGVRPVHHRGGPAHHRDGHEPLARRGGPDRRRRPHGAMVGANAGGRLTDRLGRKSIYLVER
jgi:hypothetical protein